MFRLISTGIIVMLMGTLSCGEDATEGSSDVGTGQGDTQNASEDMGVGDDTALMDTGLSGGDDDGGQGDTDETVACPLEMMEPEAGVVATDRGYVQGTQMSGGIWSFRGMPYAAPPVDDLRWAEPEPAACWNGVHMADSFGPKCPQLEVTRQGTSVIGDEDCLTINVWTPSDGLDSQQRRPVMMFIHGGGNIIGSSSEEIAPGRFLYEGQPLAERGDVVVVTFNYRLGPLGYMKLPQLDAESSIGVSGNYGLKDQIAALQWVQRNIASFGGDPDRVMLFGESAGGVNTCMMLSSPLAGGLFHRALIQSAACPAVTAEVAEETSVQALELANCSDDPEPLACMRRVDAWTLIEAAPGNVGIGSNGIDSELSWGPTVDGYVLEQEPNAFIAAEQHNKVPVVMGSNADEMAAQNINRIQIDSAQEYVNTVEFVFAFLGGAVVQEMLELYPPDGFETPNDAFIQLTTDAFFTCPVRSAMRNIAEHQDAPVYHYFFARRPELPQGGGRAAHGIELVYVFRSLENIPLYNPAQGDLAVADAMMDYWIRFAATGDPNDSEAIAWPPFERDMESYLVLDEPVSTDTRLRETQCDFWDSLAVGQ